MSEIRPYSIIQSGRAHGNKRISLTVIDVFLILNGMQLVAEEVEAVCVIKDIATGEMDEAGLAAWILDNSNEYDLDAG